MCLAVGRHLAALDIEGRLPYAGVMRTAPVANVHHAILGMCLAVSRHLAAFNIEGRSRCAGVM